MLQASEPSKPMEVGAVWSSPDGEMGEAAGEKGGRKTSAAVAPSETQPGMTQITGVAGGHFTISASDSVTSSCRRETNVDVSGAAVAEQGFRDGVRTGGGGGCRSGFEGC